jgi:hypothetical protein
MGAVTTESRLVGVEQLVQQTDGDGMHYARSCLLDELPGAVFGFITLGYLVMSLIGLAW